MQLYAAMRSIIGFDPKEKKKKTEYNTYNIIDKPTVCCEKKINDHIIYSTHYSVFGCIYIRSVYNVPNTLESRNGIYKAYAHCIYTRVSRIGT